jgi:hypothetical protein
VNLAPHDPLRLYDVDGKRVDCEEREEEPDRRRGRRALGARPTHLKEDAPLNWTLEVVCVPVSDVDRAKAFYAEEVSFRVDFDGPLASSSASSS